MHVCGRSVDVFYIGSQNLFGASNGTSPLLPSLLRRQHPLACSLAGGGRQRLTGARAGPASAAVHTVVGVGLGCAGDRSFLAGRGLDPRLALWAKLLTVGTLGGHCCRRGPSRACRVQCGQPGRRSSLGPAARGAARHAFRGFGALISCGRRQWQWANPTAV